MKNPKNDKILRKKSKLKTDNFFKKFQKNEKQKQWKQNNFEKIQKIKTKTIWKSPKNYTKN